MGKGKKSDKPPIWVTKRKEKEERFTGSVRSLEALKKYILRAKVFKTEQELYEELKTFRKVFRDMEGDYVNDPFRIFSHTKVLQKRGEVTNDKVINLLLITMKIFRQEGTKDPLKRTPAENIDFKKFNGVRMCCAALSKLIENIEQDPLGDLALWQMHEAAETLEYGPGETVVRDKLARQKGYCFLYIAFVYKKVGGYDDEVKNSNSL